MVSPSSVTPNGSSAPTTSVVLNTTARGMLGPGRSPRWILPSLGDQIELTKIAWLLAAVTLLVTVVLGRRRQVRLVLGFAMLMVALGAGCGGSVKGTSSVPGTPAGTYTLTLTGTSGTGSGAVTHSITVTVVVN